MRYELMLFMFLLLVLSPGCNQQSGISNNDGNTGISPVIVKRYEKALFEADLSNLKEHLRKIQSEYAVFLNGDLEDSLNMKKLTGFITDTSIASIYHDCQVKFADIGFLQRELTPVLRNYRHHFPEFPTPEVFTYVSGLDYEYPVQFTGQSLLIALDMYLGNDYWRYRRIGLPAYITKKLNQDYIIRDALSEMARYHLPREKVGSRLIDLMINEGKQLWFVKVMNPAISDEVLFSYSTEQLAWTTENEGLIWAFIIENDMFYSPDLTYRQKFILDGPFTSYFGNDSPPRLGQWIGYQIIRHYSERNKNIKLADLFRDYDAQNILKESGYKPKF
jgi:hypothetical protein